MEPQEAKDDFMYGCLDDEEGKVYLVQRYQSDGEWCWDVCDRPRSQWPVVQRLIQVTEVGYAVMFREEARAWSMKFQAATESTRAVETTHEGQPASEIGTKKGLVESDDEILTPTPGDG